MNRALLIVGGVLLLAPGASAGSMPVQQPAAAPRTAVDQSPDVATATRLAQEGRRLSAQQVKEAEDRLTNSPDDLATRTRLLGYYFGNAVKALGAESTRAARRRHVSWVVEHHPDSDITMLSEFTIDPAGHLLADAEGYRQVRALWLSAIERRNDDIRVLQHAARFFQLSDKALTLRYLKQAVQLAPDDAEVASQLGYAYAISVLGITMINSNGLPMSANATEASGETAKTAVTDLRGSSNPVVVTVAGSVLTQYGAIVNVLTRGAINQEILTEELLVRATKLSPGDPSLPSSLSQFYALRMQRARSPEEQRALAQKSLAQAEMVVDLSKGNGDAYADALNAAAKAAMEAAAIEKARRFATDLVTLVGDRRDDIYGQYFHDGHVVLGRVSLRDGDVEQAKAHLLQAGGTSGGGILTSFGPNMSLAKELADRGERSTVVAYLELCRSFWQSPQLTQWIVALKNGQVPNFGANLSY